MLTAQLVDRAGFTGQPPSLPLSEPGDDGPTGSGSGSEDEDMVGPEDLGDAAQPAEAAAAAGGTQAVEGGAAAAAAAGRGSALEQVVAARLMRAGCVKRQLQESSKDFQKRFAPKGAA